MPTKRLILRTMLGHDDSSIISIYDTIEHEEKLWLVPSWIDTRESFYKRPRRLISLTDLPHQKLSLGRRDADYILTIPMPRAVSAGLVRSVAGHQFVVREKPDLICFLPFHDFVCRCA